MPKLVGYRANNDLSKYSSFCNEFSSTNLGSMEDVNKFTTIDLFPQVPAPKRKVINRKPVGGCRKILSKCCPCCVDCDASANSDRVDAEFALVNHEQDKSGINEDAKSPSRNSTLRIGEKATNAAKFVSDVLNCKDAFLQKLEYSNDGTLGKTKKNVSNLKITYFSDDESCSADITSTPRANASRRSASPTPPLTPLSPLQIRESDDDIDRLVALHQNRSGLQTRSESMASVYSGAGDGNYGSVTVRGQVEFGLLYNYKMGALEINIKRCRDLAPVDTKRNRSDPYVKVYLLPDKSKSGKRKTKVRKHTLRPVFDETLRFIQPIEALGGRSLWLSIWHADMFGRNDFLGEVILSLEDKVFDDPTPKWYNLQERTEQFEEQQGSKGDLIIGLKFEVPEQSGTSNMRTKGTLHVLVKEAKNLCATKPNGLCDVFCKSYLLPERGRSVKQKTPVIRRTLSPRWEHSFLYRGVSLLDLHQRALELSVWDRDRLSTNDFMGGVRFSLGTGLYLSAPVQWMDSIGKEVSLWQTMMQRPNFWVEGSVPLRPSLSN